MKIYFKQILILILFSCSTISCNGQKNITDVRGCIEKDIFNYLVEINILTKKEDMNSRIFTVEIVNRTIIRNDKTSIYVFRAFTSHTPTFFLLKKKNSYKILSGYDAIETLEEVIDFLKNNNFDDGKVRTYIEKISEVLKSNESTYYPSKKIPKTSWVICDDTNSK